MAIMRSEMRVRGLPSCSAFETFKAMDCLGSTAQTPNSTLNITPSYHHRHESTKPISPLNLALTISHNKSPVTKVEADKFRELHW